MNTLDNKSWPGKKKEKSVESTEKAEESRHLIDGSSVLTAALALKMLTASGDVAAQGYRNYGHQDRYSAPMVNMDNRNQSQQGHGLNYSDNEKGSKFAVDDEQIMRNLQEYAAEGIHSQECKEGGRSFADAPAMKKGDAIRLADRLIQDANAHVNKLSQDGWNVIKVKTTANFDGTGKLPGVIIISFNKSTGTFHPDTRQIDGSDYQALPAGSVIWHADDKK